MLDDSMEIISSRLQSKAVRMRLEQSSTNCNRYYSSYRSLLSPVVLSVAFNACGIMDLIEDQAPVG
jgi:hypothetical protein